VKANTLDLVDYFSWSTLREDKKHTTNGICHQVDKEELLNLDAREVGYKRVDITDRVSPYDDFALDDLVIYTYIAPEVNRNPNKTFIDMSYVNSGLLGAEQVDKIAPGFLKDYISSTEICTATVDNLEQILWSYDGKKLYLLNCLNSSVVLLHSFTNYNYLIREDVDLFDNYPAICNKQDLDYRNAIQKKSGKYSNALNSSNKDILETFFSAKDLWLDLFLLRNININPDVKLKIVKRGNWLTQIIAVDVLVNNNSFNPSGDHWLNNLIRV
jgi:hypothetical protein